MMVSKLKENAQGGPGSGSGWVEFTLAESDGRELARLVARAQQLGEWEFGRRAQEYWIALGRRMGFVPNTVRNHRLDPATGLIGRFEAWPTDVVPERDDSAAIEWYLARKSAPAFDHSAEYPLASWVADAWHAGRAAAIADWAEGAGPMPDFDITAPPSLERDAALAQLVLHTFAHGDGPFTPGDAQRVRSTIERLRAALQLRTATETPPGRDITPHFALLIARKVFAVYARDHWAKFNDAGGHATLTSDPMQADRKAKAERNQLLVQIMATGLGEELVGIEQIYEIVEWLATEPPLDRPAPSEQGSGRIASGESE